jgi:hypothetical protein
VRNKGLFVTFALGLSLQVVTSCHLLAMEPEDSQVKGGVAQKAPAGADAVPPKLLVVGDNAEATAPAVADVKVLAPVGANVAVKSPTPGGSAGAPVVTDTVDVQPLEFGHEVVKAVAGKVAITKGKEEIQRGLDLLRTGEKLVKQALYGEQVSSYNIVDRGDYLLTEIRIEEERFNTDVSSKASKNVRNLNRKLDAVKSKFGDQGRLKEAVEPLAVLLTDYFLLEARFALVCEKLKQISAPTVLDPKLLGPLITVLAEAPGELMKLTEAMGKIDPQMPGAAEPTVAGVPKASDLIKAAGMQAPGLLGIAVAGAQAVAEAARNGQKINPNQLGAMLSKTIYEATAVEAPKAAEELQPLRFVRFILIDLDSLQEAIEFRLKARDADSVGTTTSGTASAAAAPAPAGDVKADK